MAHLELDADRLTVSFGRAEKLLGLVGDVSVPRSAVRSARVVGSWREVRGLRVGFGLPGYRLVGTWRRRGHRQLVSLSRGVPGVAVELEGERYDELLVSDPDATRVVRELSRG